MGKSGEIDLRDKICYTKSMSKNLNRQPRVKKPIDGTKYDAQIEKTGKYKLTAFISNERVTVTGKTLMECLEKLTTSKIVKGKCFLEVEKDKLKSSMQLSPMRVKRLYFNRVYREILEKQLNLRLT